MQLYLREEISKRIKNKNIKNFLGKPIIEITYRKLKSFKIFDKIILNTESKKIINKTKYLNFDLIIRRKKNCLMIIYQLLMLLTILLKF